MNGKLMKTLAYGIGAVVLLAGSFFLFAALTGTPLSQMKGVGGAFPDKVADTATASQGLPHPQDELDSDRRSPEQILGDSASPLKAFLLPTGFSAAELAELEAALERRMTELDSRLREVERQELRVEQDRLLYDELFAELEGLRTGLLDQEAEQEARAEELLRDQDALEAKRRAEYAKLAPIYADGKPDDVAAMLIGANEPQDAALILIALPNDRVAELISAVFRLDPGVAKTLQQAYREAGRAGLAAK